jgi:hypothetical protein
MFGYTNTNTAPHGNKSLSSTVVQSSITLKQVTWMYLYRYVLGDFETFIYSVRGMWYANGRVPLHRQHIVVFGSSTTNSQKIIRIKNIDPRNNYMQRLINSKVGSTSFAHTYFAIVCTLGLYYASVLV